MQFREFQEEAPQFYRRLGCARDDLIFMENSANS